MNQRPKRGRPKLEDPKNCILTIRMTAEEKELITKATPNGDVSEGVRRILLHKETPATVARKPNEWTCFRDGKITIHVVTSIDLSLQDWQLLRAYVEILKPQDAQDSSQ